MKKLIPAAILAAAGLLTAGSARAQMTHEVRAYIPFDFSVGNTVLPAGHYRIEPVSSPASANEVLLQNSDWPGYARLVRGTDGPWEALPIYTVSRSFLRFDHYGDQYFLRTVRAPLSAVNVEIPLSRSEEQARRDERNNQASLSTQDQKTLALN